MHSTDVNRRAFLQYSGTAALLSGIALDSPKLFAQSTIDTGEPEIDVLAQVATYLRAAIDSAFDFAGDNGALAQHYTLGNQLFRDMEAELQTIGFVYTIQGVAPDHSTPPPGINDFLAAEQANLTALHASTEPIPGDAKDFGRKALSKFLAVLGLKEFADVFYNLLNLELGELAAAIAAKNLKLAAKLLGAILKTVVSPAFLTLLGERIGFVTAGKIVAKVAGRLLPFVGWAILIGQLIWAIGEEFF